MFSYFISLIHLNVYIVCSTESTYTHTHTHILLVTVYIACRYCGEEIFANKHHLVFLFFGEHKKIFAYHVIQPSYAYLLCQLKTVKWFFVVVVCIYAYLTLWKQTPYPNNITSSLAWGTKAVLYRFRFNS